MQHSFQRRLFLMASSSRICYHCQLHAARIPTASFSAGNQFEDGRYLYNAWFYSLCIRIQSRLFFLLYTLEVVSFKLPLCKISPVGTSLKFMFPFNCGHEFLVHVSVQLWARAFNSCFRSVLEVWPSSVPYLVERIGSIINTFCPRRSLYVEYWPNVFFIFVELVFHCVWACHVISA